VTPLVIALTLTGFLLVMGLVFVVLGSRKVWLGVTPYELRKRKCRHCSGGIQALVTREDGDLAWGKIPPELLSLVRDGGDDIHRPPLANIRKCPNCAGFGSTLLPKEGR
jgi:hypothetical protein